MTLLGREGAEWSEEIHQTEASIAAGVFKKFMRIPATARSRMTGEASQPEAT